MVGLAGSATAVNILSHRPKTPVATSSGESARTGGMSGHSLTGPKRHSEEFTSLCRYSGKIVGMTEGLMSLKLSHKLQM
jgi:hypothetical protein